MLIVTQDIVDRMVAIEIANLESRLGCYARRPNNPSAVEIRRFGAATAFVAAKIPVRFFNSVLGVSEETLEHLPAIRDIYAARGVSGALEIVPGRLTERLGLELAARGYAMVEFHAGLARPLSRTERDAITPVDLDVMRVDPDDRAGFETFLDVYLEGWGTGAKDAEAAKENMRGWRANEPWRFYLAEVEGQPAGAAILDVRGKTAMLGSASTRPALRGKSVQKALIIRRMQDAKKLGCDLLVGGAYFGTPSMRNQQRGGLEVAFTRGVFVERAHS